MLEEQVGQVAGYEPDVVTLQVGVNDIVGDETEWLQPATSPPSSTSSCRSCRPERIFAITTPDHTLTEWGRARGSQEAVDALNAILHEEAAARGIEGHRHRARERAGRRR